MAKILNKEVTQQVLDLFGYNDFDEFADYIAPALTTGGLGEIGGYAIEYLGEGSERAACRIVGLDIVIKFPIEKEDFDTYSFQGKIEYESYVSHLRNYKEGDLAEIYAMNDRYTVSIMEECEECFDNNSYVKFYQDQVDGEASREDILEDLFDTFSLCNENVIEFYIAFEAMDVDITYEFGDFLDVHENNVGLSKRTGNLVLLDLGYGLRHLDKCEILIDMLKEMQANGMAIENHTENHLELNTLLKEEAYREIKNGQDYLRNVIGSKGDYLCYPVGRYSEETIEICEELGIKAAVTTEEGQASINDGRYRLKRRRIYPMSLESFQSIITN